MRLAVAAALAAAVALSSAAAASDLEVRLAAAGRVVVVPDTPRGGTPFSASMRVVWRDTRATVRSGKVTCAARVGGRSLALKARGFRRGRVFCTWALPRSAAGRNIVGWLRLDTRGAFARKWFGRPVL